MCYEIGLKPSEVRSLTMKEFNLMFTGYLARQDREWNRTRHLMACVINFAGMGAKDFMQPQTIWPLASDKEDQKKYIKTIKQCLELINEFEASLNGKVRS